MQSFRSVMVNEPVTLEVVASADISDYEYSMDCGDGGIEALGDHWDTNPNYTKTFTSPGRHTCTFTLTDPAGFIAVSCSKMWLNVLKKTMF